MTNILSQMVSSDLHLHGCVCRENYRPSPAVTGEGGNHSVLPRVVATDNALNGTCFTFKLNAYSYANRTTLQVLLAEGGKCEGISAIPIWTLGNRQNSLPP